MRRLEAAGIEIAADCINQSNLLTNDKCRQHDEGTKRERGERGVERERECGAARRKSKANNAKEISSPNSN